ncbi:hypothetical protein BY458DRAFT_557887 [Sporodiniella umbellata]|nr:hypothetical protein BY458DRAFT_557887 [Sporodiniella umbellata]
MNTLHPRSLINLTTLTMELNALKPNLQTLLDIKNQLEKNKIPNKTIHPLDKAIEEVHNKVTQIQSDIAETEKRNRQSMIKIGSTLEEYAYRAQNEVSSNLPEIGNIITGSTEKHIKHQRDSVLSLKNDLIDKYTGLAMHTSLEQIKLDVAKEKQKLDIQTNNNWLELLEDLIKKNEEGLKDVEKEGILRSVFTEVRKKVDQELKSKVQSALKTKETSQHQLLELKTFVEDKISQTLAFNWLLFTKVPFWEGISNICKNRSKYDIWTKTTHDIVALKQFFISTKESVICINQEVEKYHLLLNTIRLDYIGINKTEKKPPLAFTKSVEKVQCHAVVLKNSTKMMETALSAKKETIANKKRKRRGSDSSIFLESKLKAFQSKRQKVLDFLVMRKNKALGGISVEGILDSIEKSEENIKKHSTFFSFILDPIESIKEKEITANHVTKKPEWECFSPNTMDCLKRFIDKATFEATVPLQNQISALKKQLNNK